MNNNSNTNEIISEVSSAGQTFVSGKVEDGELHVTLKGNPADMVTYLIGSLNHTLDAIAEIVDGIILVSVFQHFFLHIFPQGDLWHFLL